MTNADVPGTSASVRSCYAALNGRSYHYLDGMPPDHVKGVIFLLHGFPDFSYGWRRQIPALVETGYRCIVPDLIGYGRTDAPDELEAYSIKRSADDLAELARQLQLPKILVGAHDWGGHLAYRRVMAGSTEGEALNHLAGLYLFHPDLVSHLFVICMPYQPPKHDFVPTLQYIVQKIPHFGYQLVFASGEVEKHIQTLLQYRQWFCGIFNGRTPEGDTAFSPTKGPLYDRMWQCQRPRSISEEDLRVYAETFYRKGIHGPLNWYRTTEINGKDDQRLDSPLISISTLFIAAERDPVLPLSMSTKMERFIPRLQRGQVSSTHWALWEAPKEVNRLIGAWLAREVEGVGSKALL